MCEICGVEIKVMIFRNDSLCSVRCRKKKERQLVVGYSQKVVGA